MKRLLSLSCVALVITMLSGCTVHYIMDYDPIIDQSFTTLQQNTEVFLAKLEAEPGSKDTSYANTKDFYVQADATLQTMKTRVSLDSKSQDVQKQISALQDSFDHLQAIQVRSGDVGPSKDVVQVAQSLIESEFASIFELQLALKTRLKPATAPTIIK